MCECVHIVCSSTNDCLHPSSTLIPGWNGHKKSSMNSINWQIHLGVSMNCISPYKLFLGHFSCWRWIRPHIAIWIVAYMLIPWVNMMDGNTWCQFKLGGEHIERYREHPTKDISLEFGVEVQPSMGGGKGGNESMVVKHCQH